MITKNAFLGTSMALILGSAAPLAQANVFEFNPVNFGGTDDTFSGDELVGTFSTGFTSTDAFASFDATGWFQVKTINLNSAEQFTGGLDASSVNFTGDYHLWFEFEYEASGGAGGGIAPSYTIDSVSYSMYAGSGVDRDFVEATNGGGTPTVTTNSGTNTLIGSATNYFGGGITNQANQSFSAVDTDFSLVNLGTFFTAPDPFFNLAFQSASTVLPALNDDFTAGTLNGTTEVRFASTPVPEPTSMALIGLGLIALGWTASRRRRAS
ncbi:flocculation-associated PEP-CTERM protein PepA [Halochromatium salexigens]|uniref:Ice-binding protein C-terminal domain-containing protein n=1 Tax=Halochromatium salexigens TaxID=49447 RepID=A0AAJ0XGC8_HALSE|nr:flocculation-associated PEP-CTERM protein PepA [Halochromatium salexigens]MBK5930542.1 hypothetical protein [Halochromatium salexigens]